MFKRACAQNDNAAFLPVPILRDLMRTGAFFSLLIIMTVLVFFSATSVSAQSGSLSGSDALPAGTLPVEEKPKTSVAPASKSTTQIIVNVIVNTQSRGDYFAELDEENNLYITPDDARTLKLHYTENRIVILRGDEPYVPLNALLDVSYTFDERRLTVTIIGKTTESSKTVADLYALRSAARNIYYPRETSAFVNYGLNYSYGSVGGFQAFTVSNKLGFRTGDVFFTSDSLYTKTENSEEFVRLQSSATYERRNDLQWLVMGDQYANSGNLGSTVNMAGIGFSKVFRLDPYFITQPVLDLTGSVIFPTEAEIYLNGVLIGREQIAPGTFELKNLYSYTGSHDIEVLLKDPFGNVQKISYRAYFSSQMLRKGLHEYSYHAGVLREQYGAKSNEYGNPVFSMFHRYGVTNNVNIGVRAEGTDGVYNIGLMSAFAIPYIGYINLSLAGSSTEGNVLGGAVSFQHSRQIGRFNTNLLLRGFTRDYATAGYSQTEDSKEYEINFGMGFPLNPIGSFSLNYADSSTFKGIDTRVFSLTYSRSLYRSVSLFATGSATWQTDADTNYGFYVGLNFMLGKNTRGSARVSGGSGDVHSQNLQVQKDMPVGEGLGYRASVNRSETPASTSTSFNPYVQYNARYGILSANAVFQDHSQSKASEYYNVSAAGSLVYAGGFFGISRPVSDSFGIVTAHKVSGASVLHNGREIGKTGASGQLIVPTLSSYGQNKITLDTKNIPIDYSISDVNRVLSPSLWSGACVNFDVQQMRAITGSLFIIRQEKKMPLEYVEVSMKVGDRNVDFPTGKGGEFYVENSLPEAPETGMDDKHNCRAIAERIRSGGNSILPGIYRAIAEYRDGKCEFSVTFSETDEVITDIGEIQCLGSQISAQPVPAPAEPVEETTPVPVPRSPSVQEGLPAQTPLTAPKDLTSVAVVKKPEKVSFILNVHFDKAETAIKKKYHKGIERLANFMKLHPETSIEIIGHTSDTGKEGYDLLLSQRRADNVQRYLIDKFGIQASRVQAFGHGSSQPVAANKTKAELMKNERIEVIIKSLVIKE